jgi:hypothetical protein
MGDERLDLSCRRIQALVKQLWQFGDVAVEMCFDQQQLKMATKGRQPFSAACCDLQHAAAGAVCDFLLLLLCVAVSSGRLGDAL